MNEHSSLEAKRHSLSHLLAAAVLEFWPEAKPTLGPPVDNGFYYDFEFPQTITESDLEKIQTKMREILPSWDTFTGFELTPQEAKTEFKNNEYKHELIDGIAKTGEKVTVYQSGKFRDLCRGGHVANMKNIKPDSWKLDRLAGAYWRGDENNKMLTRIYGLAFESKQELDDYLTQQAEAKKRDHRKLGAELDLFIFSDIIGKGLPLLTPKGTVIRKELEKFVYEIETERGYQHVITPPLAKVELYKTSGHYPYYKDTMYPVMQVDEDELILRPMTCPHHFMLYKSRPHSYRELPLRIAEMASQFRYEKSGELTGLMRVRMFCLADAHIFVTPEQAKDEIKRVLDLIDYANNVFGLKKGVDYRYRLSLGNRQDSKKYYKDDEAWENAEAVLRSVLKETAAPFFEAEGEAAFYGPKIDIQMKRVNGQEETAFTVQYDFVMPKRFNLTYINKDGQEKELVVIHRSSIGAFERTMAFLIERYAGAFPTWLAPVQTKLLPVGESHQEYCRKLSSELRSHNIRAEVDEANETIGNKIRKAVAEKVPYMIVVGDKEIESGLLAVRARGQKDTKQIKREEFINSLLVEIKERQ